MNTPIINPMWIYLINVVGSINELLSLIAPIIGLLFVVGALIYIPWRACEYYEKYDDDVAKDKLFKKMLKVGAIVTVISLTLSCVTPNKQTCYTMLVGSYITPENIESTGENIKSTIDYIFEKIDELEE